MLLRKKTYQIGLTAVVFAVGSLLAAGAVFAQVPPDPNAGNLVVEFSSTPLFEADNFLPGDDKSGFAYVENNSGAEKTVEIEAINVVNDIIDGTSERFGDALDLIIEENSTQLFNGTLTEFFDAGEFILSDLDNGANTTYDFLVTFRESVNEEYYQEKSLGFDVIIGFKGEEGVSDGGGGLPLGLIIKNVEAYDITTNSAKVEWWTSYNATSQVVYCKESENCSLDLSDNAGVPPFYGYNYTTGEENTPANQSGTTYREMTITGLQADTTYDFRCISHASPPTISRGYSFTTLAMGDNINDSDDDMIGDVADDASDSTAFQDYGTSGGDGTTGSTRARLPDGQEIGVNDANDGTSDGASLNYNAIISDTINSAGDFIGSVLGLGSADKTGFTQEYGANDAGNGQESKVEGSFKSSYEQVLLSLIILFLIIVVSLRYVYRFRVKKKKYIGDEDNTSS